MSLVNNPRGLERVQPRLEELARQMGLRLLVLFGSRVSGHSRADSDWDFAVVTDPGWEAPRSLELVGRLEDVVGGPIDLVRLSGSTDPTLLREIFAAGSRCVFEAEPGLLHEWRSLSARIHADHLVVLAQHRKELEVGAEET